MSAIGKENIHFTKNIRKTSEIYHKQQKSTYNAMKRVKFKYLLFICTILFNLSLVNGQEQLTSIDSLYIASIERFYNNAEKTKDEIWEGMKLAPVCLYRVNGPAILYNHPSPPESFTEIGHNLYLGTQKELQLYGGTQIEINGILTAIIDYGHIHYSCIEEVYAELFHELHHAYQRNFIKQIKYDKPATLLTYPENDINDAIKLYEQKVLYRMCFADDIDEFQKLLNQHYSCRIAREENIGDYMRYEEAVENMEGPAFYCEYKFYNQFAPFNEKLKGIYAHNHFFGVLTTPFYGRKSLRQRHLAAGMGLCFILDKYFDNWQSEYYTGSLSLYDFFVSKFKPHREELEIDSSYYSLSKFHTQNEVLGHQALFNEFNSQQGVKIILKFDQNPQFEGFDPMNAESINDSIILHKTFLKLSRGENNQLFITGKKTATIIEREIWFVKEAVLFVPKESVIIENNRIVVDTKGIDISWAGTLIKESDNMITFNCH